MCLPVDILPTVGQKHGGLAELAAAHLNGALAAVVVQHQLGRVDKVAITFHEVGHGHVAVRSVALRLGGLRIPVQLGGVAQAAQRTQKRDVQMGVAGGQDVGDHQSAGVDEGVAWDAFFSLQLHHGVEGRTRRFAPETLPQIITHQFQG